MIAAFLKDLRLLMRDRWLVIASMLVPIVVITIISAALFQGDSGPRLALAIVDEDGGPVVKDFRRALADHAEIVELSRDEAVRFVRDRNRGPAAVVFPPQLSERYRHGRPSDVLLLTDPAQEANLRAARLLLLLMEKKAAAQADPLAQQLITLQEHNLTGNRLAVTPFEQNLPGFTLMFVLFAVLFGTALGLYDELDWGTQPRLRVAPAGFARIVLGKLGVRFVLGVLQMLILLAWCHLVFGVSLGSSLAAVLALTCAVVLATVATGLLAAALTRSRAQAQPFALALVILLSGLGGLWWPQAMAPGWMQTVAPAFYTSWAMRGMNDLVLRDRGLAAVTEPLLVLTLYGICALALGVPLFAVRHAAR